MPEVSRAQFLKANPNQQALPGMENVSHPGAALLKQGYHFEHHSIPADHFDPAARGSHHVIEAISPIGTQAAELNWPDTKQPSNSYGKGLGQGEISWAGTEAPYRGQGIATTLYGIGRTMARVKPRHSKLRSEAGDAFAAKSAAQYGGRLPKKQT